MNGLGGRIGFGHDLVEAGGVLGVVIDRFAAAAGSGGQHERKRNGSKNSFHDGPNAATL